MVSLRLGTITRRRCPLRREEHRRRSVVSIQRVVPVVEPCSQPEERTQATRACGGFCGPMPGQVADRLYDRCSIQLFVLGQVEYSLHNPMRSLTAFGQTRCR